MPKPIDSKLKILPNSDAIYSGTRFDSASMATENCVTLRSSIQESRLSMGNGFVNYRKFDQSLARPDSQSSETEFTSSRVRPASADVGARCSRYAIPSLLARGSRLLSAPVCQTSPVLRDAFALQTVLGNHSERSKSHVAGTFAKVL